MLSMNLCCKLGSQLIEVERAQVDSQAFGMVRRMLLLELEP
jgi:hypothetical protein